MRMAFEKKVEMSTSGDLISWVDPALLAKEKKILQIKRLLIASPPTTTVVQQFANETDRQPPVDDLISKPKSRSCDSVCNFDNSWPNVDWAKFTNESENATLLPQVQVHNDHFASDLSYLYEFDPLLNRDAGMGPNSDSLPVLSAFNQTSSAPAAPTRPPPPAISSIQPSCNCNFTLSPREPSWLNEALKLGNHVLNVAEPLKWHHGVVISRRLDGYRPSVSSLKIIVHVKFAREEPIVFTCDISSSVEHIIGCVLCSIFPVDFKQQVLPIDTYALKLYSSEEYLKPHTSICEYYFIHECVKLGKDPEFDVVLVPDRWRKAPRNVQFQLVDNLQRSPIVQMDLEVVLSTVTIELKKMLHQPKEGASESLCCRSAVQSVKALCSLLNKLEPHQLVEAVKSLQSLCNAAFKPLCNCTCASHEDRCLYFNQLKICINAVVDAVVYVCETYCESSVALFTIDNPKKTNLSDLPVVEMVDIQENFTFQLESVHNLPPAWKMKYVQFLARCHLIHGLKDVAQVIRTNCALAEHHFYDYLLFNSTVTFSIPICALPREVKLCVVLCGKRPETCQSEANVATGSGGNMVEDQLCFTLVQLFDSEGVLRNRSLFAPFYQDCRVKPWLVAPVLSDTFVNAPTCVLNFPNGECRLKFPNIKLEDDMVNELSQLDAESQMIVEDIIENRGIRELDADEKDLLWEKRMSLCHKAEALPLVLLSVISWDWACLHSINAMLDIWCPLPPSIAIELLLPNFADAQVRAKAVKWLGASEIDSLIDLLPQMAEALCFENFENSSLAQLLLHCSLNNRHFAFALYWELEHRKVAEAQAVRCHLLQLVLVSLLHPDFECDVKRQLQFVSILDNLKKRLNGLSKDSQKMKVLQIEMGLLDSSLLDNSMRLPFEPGVQAVGVLVEQCKIFHSLTNPVKICFRTTLETYEVMYKAGDDLRQDALVLQLVSLMDYLWLKEGIDLRTIVYRVLPLCNRKGLIELVKGAKTLREIQTEEAGVAGVLRGNSIKRWLQKHSTSELDYQMALKNFRCSCAAWSVATYVLGIGDRHNDNVMITSRGHLFHIDFGKYLGDVQMFGSFKRDRVPFLLTDEMLHAVNADDSDGSANFQEMVDSCCHAFNVIRKHSALYINLMKFMLYANVPGLTPESVLFLRSNLWPECTDIEASVRFTRMIEESLASIFPKLNFLVHTVAQSARKSITTPSHQIFSFVPLVYTMETDGTIRSVEIVDCEKWKDQDKVYMYKLKVERENVKVPTYLYRSYNEFVELAEVIYSRFPLIRLYNLSNGGGSRRRNCRAVAQRRQYELSRFMHSIFALSQEIAHSNIVYTFFHPLFRDEKADIQSKTIIVPRLSQQTTNVTGEIKVQVAFDQGMLEVFINHARNLSLINGCGLPDSYVKCYIQPDRWRWSKKKTRIVRGTRNPTFNEMFVYRCLASQLISKHLEITLWHHDMLKENTFLGAVSLPMNQVCSGSGFKINGWFALQSRRFPL